jgi:hypothetical protein
MLLTSREGVGSAELRSRARQPLAAAQIQDFAMDQADRGAGKISSATVVDPRQALVRLLNSTRDFAAAVSFIKRAKQYDGSTIEHAALYLGALICYSRPFRARDGFEIDETLDQSPVFLAVATDIGADLELHATVVGLSIQAMACTEPLCETMQRAANASKCKVLSFSFPYQFAPTFPKQLDLEAFERIANLMRLACVFTLSEIADPKRRHKTAHSRD